MVIIVDLWEREVGSDLNHWQNFRRPRAGGDPVALV
jgi:hypothetical protein